LTRRRKQSGETSSPISTRDSALENLGSRAARRLKHGSLLQNSSSAHGPREARPR
jgi:hypothetical protein